MNRVIKRFIMSLTVMLAVIAFGGKAYAIPTLQLDIAGGTYDSSTETIVTTDTTFTLYAYLIADRNHAGDMGDTYYVSVALLPVTGSGGFGSFTIDGGAPIDVTADMESGRPYDLPGHGIYDTSYYEQSFSFNSGDTTGRYDTVTGATAFGDMYYVAFDMDRSDLPGEYTLHFDLYNVATGSGGCGGGHSGGCGGGKNGGKNGNGNGGWKCCKGNGSGHISEFAPFSHDAESVPEPATILLLGIGLLGLFIVNRKLHLGG